MGSLLRVLVLALIALMASQVAMAQYRQSGAVTLISGTTTVAATSTNDCTITNVVVFAGATNTYVYHSDIDVRESSGIALYVSFSGYYTNDNSDNVTLVLKRGIDESTFETAETFRIDVAESSTNTVVCLTNLTVGWERFLRLAAIENATTNVITNLVVSYSFKR